jgi:hypothetical protein
MPRIRASEQLDAITVVSFAAPAANEQIAESRQGIVDLLRRATQREIDPDTDASGRRVLIGYKAIRDWMNYWGTVQYLPA